jgi:hypothetical protein
MQRITTMATILSLILLLGIVPTALAGIEPFPPRAEVSAYQLDSVEGYSPTASKEVKTVLGSPTEDVIPVIKKLSDVVDYAKAIDLTEKAYLGTPPNDQISQEGFFEALGQLLESAKVLNDSALGDMDKLTAVER